MTADGSATPDGELEAPGRGPDTSIAHTPNSPPEPDSGGEGLWDAYWERFRRQQVDDAGRRAPVPPLFLSDTPDCLRRA